jgi:hypothetical protein
LALASLFLSESAVDAIGFLVLWLPMAAGVHAINLDLAR